MADPRALLDEFVAAFEGGDDPDPAELLRRVDPARRQELDSMIDSYLMTAPRRAWDPAGYESSGAKAAVDRAFESIEGVSGTWPELLPRLRHRAQIKRREVVRRLAEALGVGEADPRVEKVGAYYHRMEHGLLPAEGVSGRVIEALAAILGSSAEAIRDSGATRGVEAGGDAPAFARMASLDVSADLDFDAQRAAPASSDRAEEDEIDRLFTGGSAG